MKATPRRFILLAAGALVLLAVVSLIVPTRAAQPSTNENATTLLQTTEVPGGSALNEPCLVCHNNPTLTMTLPNGEVLGLYVPQEVYNLSVHGMPAPGATGYACVQCHSNITEYPHPPFPAQSAREASLLLVETCRGCHSPQFDQVHDSVHAAALAAGNQAAAVCTDCHGAHGVQRLHDPQTGELTTESRAWVPQTCAKCHYAIFQQYQTSVHGAALLDENNPDVPTCTDCHGVHSITGPSETAFRLRSPQICASCHTDPSIMDQYGISTNVVETYVSDFHGTTVTLFEQQHPDQEVNAAVCYDCHGAHDIYSADDPEKGLRVKENLLARCQQCHPEANENFPTAWLSHYIPDAERYPTVFFVDVFYKFFIPTVLGGMGLLVVLDAATLLRKRKDRRPVESPIKSAFLPDVTEDAGATGDSAVGDGDSAGASPQHEATTPSGDGDSVAPAESPIESAFLPAAPEDAGATGDSALTPPASGGAVVGSSPPNDATTPSGDGDSGASEDAGATGSAEGGDSAVGDGDSGTGGLSDDETTGRSDDEVKRG